MGKAGFLLVGERGQSPFFPLSDLNVVENFDQAHEGQTCDRLHLVISCHCGALLTPVLSPTINMATYSTLYGLGCISADCCARAAF